MREFINGLFIEECKNRFLCRVLVNGIDELCYVSSSARLSNFLKLSGCQVLLRVSENQNRRTRFTLEAVRSKDKYILLNLNAVNGLLQEANNLSDRYNGSSIIAEKCSLLGYRSDFTVIGNKTTIIEVKSVLADCPIAFFPVVTGDRATKQLQIFESALKHGFGVDYYIALLNSEITQVHINSKESNYLSLLKSCINSGMRVFTYCLDWPIDAKPEFVERSQFGKNFLREISTMKVDKKYAKQSNSI